MTTKIDVSKLVKRPVPAGHKIKYRHVYKTQDGRPLVYATFLGRGSWWIADGNEVSSYGIEYMGPLRLVSTEAFLETDDGILAASATAQCNPKDTPIKKLGVAIAHNRCIKQFEALSHARNG